MTKLRTFEYSFDDLPLVIDLGFEACTVCGSVEISYDRDGEWNVESIYFAADKRIRHTVEAHMQAAQAGTLLPAYERKPVALEAGSPIYSIIWGRLENEWRDQVADAVADALREDRENAAADRADYEYDRRRDDAMEFNR